MNTVDRALGRLEAGQESVKESVDTLTRIFKEREDKASEYRQQVREQLHAIDDKIDPVLADVETLKLQVKAHDVVIASYEDRRKERNGADRLARWLIHGAWMLVGGLALIWSDYVKGPWHKLIVFLMK